MLTTYKVFHLFFFLLDPVYMCVEKHGEMPIMLFPAYLRARAGM
jgi:hypothetical protein